MQNIVNINRLTNEAELKDGLGNVVQLTDNGALNLGNASLGGYTNRLVYVIGPGSVISATFIDIPGGTDQAFTTPVSGVHTIQLSTFGMYQTGTSGGYYDFGVNIDGIDYAVFQHLYNAVASLEYQQASGFVTISLAAGTHTIRPRWRRVTGTSTLNSNTTALYVHIQAQGTGINGLNIFESQLASTHVIGVTEPTYEQVDTVEVTFTSLQNEKVEISFDGAVQQLTAAYGTYRLGYQVDGDPVVITWTADAPSTSSGVIFSANWSAMSTPLTAGLHTIKLITSKAAGSGQILGTSATLPEAKFRVIRYRGGSIFGTPVDASLTPDTDNIYDLGTSGFRFNDIWAGGNINNQGAALQLSSNDQNINIGGGSGAGTLELNIRTGASGTPQLKLAKGANNWTGEHGTGNSLIFKYNSVACLVLAPTGGIFVIRDLNIGGDLNVAGNIKGNISPRIVVDVNVITDTFVSPGSINSDVVYRVSQTIGGTLNLDIDGGGFDGQIVTIYTTVDTTGIVRVNNGVPLFGGVTLNMEGDAALQSTDTVTLMYDSSVGMWNEVSRSNN